MQLRFLAAAFVLLTASSALATYAPTKVVGDDRYIIGTKFAIDESTGAISIGHQNPQAGYAVDIFEGSFVIAGELEQGLYFRRWGDMSGGNGPIDSLWMVGRMIASPPLYKSQFRFVHFANGEAEHTVLDIESTGTVASVRNASDGLGSHFEGWRQMYDTYPLFRINSYGGTGIEFGEGGMSIDTDVSWIRLPSQPGVMSLRNGVANNAGAAMEYTEIAAPAQPSAGNIRTFARDNGAGKQQFCIKWDDNTVTCPATQS